MKIPWNELWTRKKPLAVVAVALGALLATTGGFAQITVNSATGLNLFVYSVKYECMDYPDDPPFADNYAVEVKINVHNPHLLPASINTKLLELDAPFVDTNPETPTGPIISRPSVLEHDTGFNVDCTEIYDRETECFGMFPPPTPREGFVVIESLLPLDVVALYKIVGSPYDGAGFLVGGQGADIEYETIVPQITPGPFSPMTPEPCNWTPGFP